MTVDEKKEEKKKTEDGKDVDFDGMWNTILKFNDVMEPIMGSDEDSDRVCPRTVKGSCPTGHYLVACSKQGEYRCAQCRDHTFQPSENWWGDKCRLRKNCSKQNMHYVDLGSTTRDANCACNPGYHFPNEDQRSCVPNKRCPKGYTHGLYGNCESCLEKSMFSASEGSAQKCSPLTNCEKKQRCTIVRSDGTQDNVCGPVVSNLKTCKELEPGSTDSTSTTIAIACGITGAIFLIIVILVLFMFLRSRRRRRRMQRHSRRSLSAQHQEELRHQLLKEADRNPALCSKAFSTSFRFIEERINKQIWDLARELFRSHHERDKYEKIVRKFKDTPSQAQRSIHEYLHEWRQWRGESKTSMEELFRCLHQVKRENIINEICLCLSNDIDFQRTNHRSTMEEETLGQECCAIFFPCCAEKKTWKEASFNQDTGVKVQPDQAVTKLLDIASDDMDDFNEGSGGCGMSQTKAPPPGTFCPPEERPSPSAPALEDHPTLEFHTDAKKYKCQYSHPVQATS